MVNVKIIDGSLYNYNILLVEERNNDDLMNRLCSMLKYEINSYQRKMILNSIDQIKMINSITKSA